MKMTHSKRPPEAMFLTDPMMAVILQPIDSRITVIHDSNRCCGYIQAIDAGFKAFWSGDHFDDHLISEFKDKAEAVKAAVRSARKQP